jgi:hypothetical protein
MPIEILELVVRANVQETNEVASGSIATDVNDGESLPRQQLVEECVTQVLEILKQREER